MKYTLYKEFEIYQGVEDLTPYKRSFPAPFYFAPPPQEKMPVQPQGLYREVCMIDDTGFGE